MSGNGVGRLEVFYREHWGFICSYGWDINDAMVVCRQLGYKYAVRTFEEQGRPWLGQIWLDDVNCTGNEQNLTSCSYRVWRSGFGCQDRRIGFMAAVECSSTGKIFMYTLLFWTTCILIVSILHCSTNSEIDFIFDC